MIYLQTFIVKFNTLKLPGVVFSLYIEHLQKFYPMKSATEIHQVSFVERVVLLNVFTKNCTAKIVKRIKLNVHLFSPSCGPVLYKLCYEIVLPLIVDTC